MADEPENVPSTPADSAPDEAKIERDWRIAEEVLNMFDWSRFDHPFIGQAC